MRGLGLFLTPIPRPVDDRYGFGFADAGGAPLALTNHQFLTFALIWRFLFRE